ncbi:MAG: acetyltransferase [Sedimentisphaerales bacterium]|nr:acetyltransferase [Sedimentisphaerales bacterium]
MGSDARLLLILGTRTFAEEVADWAGAIPQVRVAGFVENMDAARCRETLGGVPIHWIDDIGRFAGTHEAVCALSTTRRSRFIQQAEDLGITFATLIHPAANVSSQTQVGKGAIVGPGVVIGSHTHVGPHVVVNRGALIGHHTRIGRFCTVQPGANIAGACTIGEATYVGMGAVILDHVTVGSHAIVGAGAVVTRDVPDRVQVVGVPARIVKEDIEGK